MNEKQLQALSHEPDENLKTPDYLDQFDRLLKKISVEAALDPEITQHVFYDEKPATDGNQRPQRL